MGQTLCKNYLHIVFSTKHRNPLIIDEVESELYGYIGATCKRLECHPIRINGYKDHIHILCMLSRKIALMELLEEIKRSSSKWIKTRHQAMKNFYWQDGYGAFSVNPSEVDRVIKYIENQKEHHAKKTFKEEFRLILKKYQVEFDERYVWD